MDLHLHTPGSNDYQEPTVSYLDILRQAELRGLDIIAFTDHNTVAGYAAMRREIDMLHFLQQLDRLTPHEARRLAEYERLLEKILVLPGFEFTATFGFHIIGLFPPDTPINFLDHLLLTLKIPLDSLQTGSSNVGATADVLTAYHVIDDAGGITVAAHANSSNGVAMRGMSFGGQTRIAYTQDPALHVLEVTDLEKRGRHTTQQFFNGSKPEYPRPMRCIQGSDAHRLTRDPEQQKSLGIGDRITEILLDNLTFEALAVVLKGSDLSLTRPFRGKAPAYDFVQAAQEQGESVVQAFHKSMAERGGHFMAVLADICAMANTNGGTIYVGVSADPEEKPAGIPQPARAITRLKNGIVKHFSPEPVLEIDTLKTQGRSIIRITVSTGPDLPYAIDQYRFYVRDESGTNIAVRDEIAQLVQRGLQMSRGYAAPVDTSSERTAAPAVPAAHTLDEPQGSIEIAPPRTGVEVVASEERQGTTYHTLRDLRNGNLIKNVTKSSARKLWHYAITQTESGTPDPKKIRWQGRLGLVGKRQRDDRTWWDLALRDNGDMRIYYGVTDSGMNDAWLALIESQDN